MKQASRSLTSKDARRRTPGAGNRRRTSAKRRYPVAYKPTTSRRNGGDSTQGHRKVPTKKRVRSTKFRATGNPAITIKNGRIVMLLPRRLRTPNKRGSFWAERSERQAWRNLLLKAAVTTDGSLVLPIASRMRLEIMRLAPSKRYVLDKDNLEFSAKRLQDTLVELGYLIDDDRHHVDGPWMTQGLSEDKCYWTIVTLKPAEPYIECIATVSPSETAAKQLLARRGKIFY